MTDALRKDEDGSLESLIGKVADDFLHDQENGEQPDIEHYVARYPQAAPILRKVLAALCLLEQSASSAAAPEGEHLDGALAAALGDFRIIRQVGRGGMGVVYEAEQVSLGRRVALKVLPFAGALDARQLQRFKNEAQAAAQLHHTNIVPIITVGTDRGVHYYTMQYIEGRSLAQVISDLQLSICDLKKSVDAGTPSRPATPEPAPVIEIRNSKFENTALAMTTEHSITGAPFFRTVASLGIQAAEALEHAHCLGIVHRDIKPANLLIDGSPGTTHHSPRLWITDFGLARFQTEAGLTLTGDLLGTLRYMSPEQALARREHVDHRTDIYSLGVTLYELTTLRPAFGGRDRQELLRQIAWEEPLPPRQVTKAIPGDLETIILKASAKEPADRYATAQQLADDLRRFLEDKPIRAKRPSMWQRARKWSRRHSALMGAGVITLLVAVVALTVSTVFVTRERAEAIRQRDAAETQRQIADEQRALAETRELVLRRRHYADDMKLAYHAWANGQSNRLGELLSRHLPGNEPEDLRGFEWHFLWGARKCLLRTLRGHTDYVYHVAFSPDGAWIASASVDETVRLWDVATGLQVGILRGHQGDVNWVTFSPDGETLASAGDDGTVKLWHRTSAGTPPEFALRATLPGHKGDVLTVEFSPDGKLLASGGLDTEVRIWNPADGGLQAYFKAHERDVTSLAFSADGKLLATGSRDGMAKLWEVSRFQQAHAGKKLTLSPFRSCLATISTTPPSEQAAEILSLAFASGDRKLVMGCTDYTVKEWDLLSAQASAGWSHSYYVHRLACSAIDTALIASAGGADVRISNQSTGEFRGFRAHVGRIRGLAFSPDGETLATASSDHTVKLWNLVAVPFRVVRRAGVVTALAYSPDGRKLALGMKAGVVTISDPTGVTDQFILKGEDIGPDPSNEKNLGPRHPGSIAAVAFSPDGRWLAALSLRGTMYLWDAATGQLQAQLALISGEGSFVFSPDGTTLVTLGKEGIALWDVPSLKRPALPRLSNPAITFLSFSPDGRTLAASNQGGELLLFDFASQELSCVRRTGRGRTTWVKFSPDGGTIATGNEDGTVTFWDAASAESRIIFSHPGGSFPVSGCFSPDGKTLATCGSEGVWRLWHVATGQELFCVAGGGISFSPDGHRLMALTHLGDSTTELHQWTLTADDPPEK